MKEFYSFEEYMGYFHKKSEKERMAEMTPEQVGRYLARKLLDELKEDIAICKLLPP
jgi:hypothetical protein